MFSHYQHHATSYANLSLVSAHEINSDLHRQAEALAPRFAEETAEAGCTNLRPGDDQPRRQKAWDLIAEALAWNLIADDRDVVAAARQAERDGRKFQVGYAWNIASGERLSYQQPFVIILAPDAPFLSYAEIRAIEDRVAKGTTVVFADPQVGQAAAKLADQGFDLPSIDVQPEGTHVTDARGFGFTAHSLTGQAKAEVFVRLDGTVTARQQIRVPQGRIGDVVWSYGFRVAVEEVEHFENCTQLRGQVTNYDQIAATDPALARYIDAESRWSNRPGQHWWKIQGNDLAPVTREVPLA